MLPTNAKLIYFLGEKDGTTIKFGITDNYETFLNRWGSHEGHGPRRSELQFLAILRTTSDANETALKHHFKNRRADGKEWITLNKADREWIRWLRSQDYVVHTCDREPNIQDKETINNLEVVDFEKWRPIDSRTRKSASPFFGFWSPLEIKFMGAWGDLHIDGLKDLTPGDHWTNPKVISLIREVIDGKQFDLDVASSKSANHFVNAKNYYGEYQDGCLANRQWYGIVWLNPPFKQWKVWAPKALREWHSGRITDMFVFITNGSMVTKQVAPLMREANAIWIPSQRYKTIGPKSNFENTYGNPILYFGKRLSKFNLVMGKHGTVFPGTQFWKK